MFYRRQLPHLQRDNKPHFLTFCTDQRRTLPAEARKIVLECCLHDHDTKFDLQVVVVMPDHVHLILTPQIDRYKTKVYLLAEITNAIKGASAHGINKLFRRKGRVWQPASFDHVLRSSESLQEKVEYVLQNPVRRGLVCHWSDYPWIWKNPLGG